MGLDVAADPRARAVGRAAMPRWEVLSDVALGLFSFTKYLMWLDLDRRSDVLTKNAVVHHLLETPEAAFPSQGEFPDPRPSTATRPPTDTFVPLDADSSQQAAIFAAADGHTFVLEGPPGTGKSQTISNLICHALATGKRVLFVSEKMAALNVVHKRLAKVGLAPFCLELHSNKARKRVVLEQLRAALDVAGAAAPDTWPRVAERLGDARTEVNAHAEALHRPRSFGRSAFHGIARLIALRGEPKVKLALGAVDAIDAARRETLDDAVAAARVALEDVGDVRDHAWARIEPRSSGHRPLDSHVDEEAPALEAAADALEAAVGGRGGGPGRRRHGSLARGDRGPGEGRSPLRRDTRSARDARSTIRRSTCGRDASRDGSRSDARSANTSASSARGTRPRCSTRAAGTPPRGTRTSRSRPSGRSRGFGRRARRRR